MTTEQRKLPFRPCLVIFVDEVGKQICQQFRSSGLLDYLDVLLRPCIGFIWYKPAPEHTASWRCDKHTDWMLNGDAPRAATQEHIVPLEAAIKEMLSQISVPENVQAGKDAGYDVPDEALPQIIIAGHSSYSTIGHTLRIVCQQLRNHPGVNQPTDFINYVLRCNISLSKMTDADSATPDSMPGNNVQAFVQPDEREVPHFCFLYADMPGLTETQCNYAAAEGIFALITTDLTRDIDSSMSKNAAKHDTTGDSLESASNQTTSSNAIQDMVKQDAAYFGSLSTCLITFPHKVLRDYYNARYAQVLLDQCLSSLNTTINRSHAQVASSSKETEAQIKIRKWIDENMPTVSSSHQATAKSIPKWWSKLLPPNDHVPPLWDGLALLEDESDSEIYQKVKESIVALFSSFTPTNIPRAAFSQIWTEKKRKAKEDYRSLEKTLSAAWRSIETKICSLIEQIVCELWEQREFQRAAEWLQGFKKQLTDLEKELGKLSYQTWRDSHYRKMLEAFKRSSERKRNISPFTRATSSSAFQEAPKETIEQQLQQCAFKSGSAGLVLMTTSILATLALAPLALTLFSRWLEKLLPLLPIFTIFPQSAHYLLTLLLTIVILLVIIVLSSQVFSWLSWRDAIKARKDLLSFHFCCYAYQLADDEHQLRISVVKSLHEKLEHLANFEENMQPLKEYLQALAASLPQLLTDTFDVFIGMENDADQPLQLDNQQAELFLQRKCEQIREQLSSFDWLHFLREFLFSPLQTSENHDTASWKTIWVQALLSEIDKVTRPEINKFFSTVGISPTGGTFSNQRLSNYHIALRRSVTHELTREKLLNRLPPHLGMKENLLQHRYAFLSQDIPDLPLNAIYFPQQPNRPKETNSALETNSLEWTLDTLFLRQNIAYCLHFLEVDALFPLSPRLTKSEL